MPQTHQLAAIMFTDIVGYTALMGQDERKAFQILNKNRELHKRILDQYEGRFIKELGDGILASFQTISNAVYAAIEIQKAVFETKDFQLRIGIHLGEVVFDNDDVFGDGVNIASRIQALANPGSIFISEAVHYNVFNKSDIKTSYVKETKLKNVKEPVKIYQVIAEGVSKVLPLRIDKIKREQRPILYFASIIVLVIAVFFVKSLTQGPQTGNPDGKGDALESSIAVLPFLNIGADSSQEYFSDGITESLITTLAQIPGLRVISKNSVSRYKGKPFKPAEIGKELAVGYILEGSVQRSGDVLRVSVQLIATQTGFHLWANKFDRQLKDVFQIQDDISGKIVSSLKIALAPGAKAPSSPTDNLEAYDYYLRGRYLTRQWASLGRKNIDSAISMFEKAIEIDPRFALAYAALGRAYSSVFFIYEADPKWEAKSFVAIEKALSIDPRLAEAYVAKANLTWTLSNGFPHEKAIKELKQAIELNPNLVEAHEGLGSVYFHIGLLDEALHELRIALTLDPTSNFARPRVARVHWYQQKFDSALKGFASLQPSAWLREHALVLWYLGKTDEAFRVLEQFKAIQREESDNSDLAAVYAVLFAGIGKKQQAEENIRLAISHGEGVSHFHHAEHLIASSYALMGQSKAAVEWLQKTADHGLPCYSLFKNDPNLKSLSTDSAYIALMEKLKQQWQVYKSKFK